tara:strand:+ start:758 stop:1462 length:705 start_codon:yes stop_codon:yes gene_type:complete
MKDSEYEELLKERKKEIKNKKNYEIPKGAIPVPPPNWNKKQKSIPIIYPPHLEYESTYNLGDNNYFATHNPVPPIIYENLDNILYEDDSDEYNFDGNEIFDSLDSKKTNSIDDKSPIIPPTTPRRINKSKLIPIKSKSESDITSLNDDIIIGNPYDKRNVDKLNSIKTHKNSPKNKNKTVKKNSRKMPGPLKLPGLNGGRKNKTSRKHTKKSRKHTKTSRKHTKTSRKHTKTRK